MTYEAGFCVFAFVAFCAVVVYALYRRALVVDDAVRYDGAMSRDDVLDLAIHVHSGDAAGSQTGAPEAWEHVVDCTELVKAASKEWQPHDTDKMPVDLWNDVRVMFRDGTISDIHQACHLRWWPLDEESDADILAYRIEWPCF